MIANWREVVETLSELKTPTGGFSYSFVVGAHPHEAKHYDDRVEATILEAHRHPSCVGWGEIGLVRAGGRSALEKRKLIWCSW